MTNNSDLDDAFYQHDLERLKEATEAERPPKRKVRTGRPGHAWTCNRCGRLNPVYLVECACYYQKTMNQNAKSRNNVIR